MPSPRQSSRRSPRGRGPCPLPAAQVLDLYFLEHRARVVDIAAFLDRLDRARDGRAARRDHRLLGLFAALRLLTDGRPQRARRVLELLSDATREPIPAAGTKGATGVDPAFARRGARGAASRGKRGRA